MYVCFNVIKRNILTEEMYVGLDRMQRFLLHSYIPCANKASHLFSLRAVSNWN